MKQYKECRAFTISLKMISLFYFTSLFLPCAFGDVFTSAFKIQRMALDERIMVEKLRYYLENKYGNHLDIPSVHGIYGENSADKYAKINYYLQFLKNRSHQIRNQNKGQLRNDLKHPNAVYTYVKKTREGLHRCLRRRVHPF